MFLLSVRFMSAENISKKQRLDFQDDEDVKTHTPKYPYIDHDKWMKKHVEGAERTIVVTESDDGIPALSGPPTARPTPSWFSLGADSQVSTQARSAQYSAVAHSPHPDLRSPVVSEETEEDDGLMLYSKWDMVNKYIEFRLNLPDRIYHPYFSSDVFREAVIADIVSNSVRRDPALYKSVWPRSIMGIPGVVEESNVAELAIAQTEKNDAAIQDKLPWSWETANRRDFIIQVIEAVGHTSKDLVIPFHGLILSPWVSGILFRLSQLFFKITVVRSQLSPSWDDSCFIFCQGKRASSKLVDKAFKLLTKLVPENPENDSWGYSVPPVCFTDPCLSDWLRSVNAQLMGPSRVSLTSGVVLPTINQLASQFRLKKYLFPNARTATVGFYFGSFNPVHENHVALAEFAIKNLGLYRVLFVPNDDDHEEKKDMLVPRVQRAEILRVRGLEVLEPSGSTKRWEAKAAIAEEYTNRLFEESEMSGIPALLLGQDSWNKAVLGSSRDKVTRHFIGISKLVKTKIFIFPRTNCDSETGVLPAPKPIRENIEIVDGYSDPLTGLSSSGLREILRTERTECPTGIHPSVFKYISEHNLYI